MRETYFAPERPEDLLAPLADTAAWLFADIPVDRVRKCARCVGPFLRQQQKKATGGGAACNFVAIARKSPPMLPGSVGPLLGYPPVGFRRDELQSIAQLFLRLVAAN